MLSDLNGREMKIPRDVSKLIQKKDLKKGGILEFIG